MISGDALAIPVKSIEAVRGLGFPTAARTVSTITPIDHDLKM
jgi:hypothetical protein